MIINAYLCLYAVELFWEINLFGFRVRDISPLERLKILHKMSSLAYLTLCKRNACDFKCDR